jgi:Lon protease-like protein
MTQDASALSDFDGKARLFPLPNLVLFPNVVQPLHIFEPRYRAMTADALAGDRLIAVVLLAPGWEEDYDGRPAIRPVACLGKVVADQRLADGRYNLLLRGLSRVRVRRELGAPTPYRVAEVELLADAGGPASTAEAAFRRRLAQAVPVWFPGKGALVDQFLKLVEGDLPLGTLCDVFGFTLQLPVEFKQELLELLDVEQRVVRLLGRLEGTSSPPAAPPGEADRKWPPDFSSN